MSTFLALLLVGVHITVYVWDVCKPDDTVSKALTSWSYSYPIFPLMVGVLMGHIFWK